MNSIATTIEQSKKLLELGLDDNSADMHYYDDHYNIPKLEAVYCHGWYEEYKNCEDDYIPAWSLEALLELMPKDIILERSGYKYNHRLYLTYNYEAEKWTVLYSNKIWDDIVFFGKTSTDAAYNMVVWLLENNYIKKEKI